MVLQREVERLKQCVTSEQREKERLLPLLQSTEDKGLLAEVEAHKFRGGTSVQVDRSCRDPRHLAHPPGSISM